jgi:uncharacterized membrane protein YdbT with pleckstrin-like domain
MGYVNENLITDEVVKYRARLHWAVLVGPAISAAFLAIVGAFLTIQVSGWGVAFVVIGAIPLAVALIKRSAAEFAVTNKRVILKTGVVRRRTAEMFLNKIESVGVDQTVLGRILNYGSIVVHGTGGSSEPFDFVAKPLELRRQVQEQIGGMNDRTVSAKGR